MKKGKHIKKRMQKKKKLNWKKVFGLIFIVIFVGTVITSTTGKGKNEKQLEKTEEEVEEAFSDATTNEEVEVAFSNATNSEEKVEAVIKPSEDIKIKAVLEGIQEEKGLNEKNFAFFYYNIDKKTYYFYNENKYFTAASTVKMPIAMVYYDKVENGELTLEDSLVYTKDCYEEGGGSTAYTYSVGQSISIQYLLKQSVINSDNTAVNILIKNLGSKEYRYDIAKYADEELPDEFYSENIISASYAYNVVNYLYQHQEKYVELIDYLKQSSEGEYLKKYIDQYEVAHKYGSYNGYVHDYGIVFGENPYLIGIFTKGVPNADEIIANISLEILEENEKTQ